MLIDFWGLVARLLGFSGNFRVYSFVCKPGKTAAVVGG